MRKMRRKEPGNNNESHQNHIETLAWRKCARERVQSGKKIFVAIKRIENDVQRRMKKAKSEKKTEQSVERREEKT